MKRLDPRIPDLAQQQGFAGGDEESTLCFFVLLSGERFRSVGVQVMKPNSWEWEHQSEC